MSGEIVLWRRRKEDFEAKEERRERERGDKDGEQISKADLVPFNNLTNLSALQFFFRSK